MSENEGQTETEQATKDDGKKRKKHGTESSSAPLLLFKCCHST